MIKWILVFFLWTISLCADTYKRDYFAMPTAQETKDIHYIISTLGNTATVGLLFKKKSLEQAGDRIGHIHPLRFFNIIFSNSSLKSSFAKISGMAWKNFEDGMVGSLDKADAKENLNIDIIDDFSHSSNLDVVQIKKFVEDKQWKKLINFLRKRA